MSDSPFHSTALRVHSLSTFYPHLGEHMGYRQVRKYFDAGRVSWSERLVKKDREYLSAPFRTIRKLTRTWFSQPPMMYMLEDWLGERAMLRAAREGKMDILQYLDGEHSFCHGARWISKVRNRPKIATLFHLPPELTEVMVERDAIRRLDAIVTLSPDQADWFKSWVDPTCVHIVKHGVDDAFFHPAAEGPPPEAPWRILTVGSNFRDYKLLFEVAAQLGDLPDVQFHVVKRFRAGTVIPSNVRVHTGLSDEDLAALYRRCHICLLPLTKATASNALLEAMASGLPTVVSDLYSVRSYASEKEACFFPVGNAEAAAARVRALLEDPAQRLRMGKSARAIAEKTNWQASADGLTRVYEKIAGRSPAVTVAS